MDVSCPYCGTEHSVPPDFVGRKAVCSHCKRSFIIQSPKCVPSHRVNDNPNPPYKGNDKSTQLLEQAVKTNKLLMWIGVVLTLLLLRSCYPYDVKTEYSRGGVHFSNY